MAKTTEEVQVTALQKAAAQHGVPWNPAYGVRMTSRMKYVFNIARERGLVIQVEGDLTEQVIRILSDILLETATAYATVGLNLQAINKEVRGTSVEGGVIKFNQDLHDLFGQHLLTLNRGVTGTLFRQLEPIEIVETRRSWIQRLLLPEE
jgi:hypothetical protein